MTLVWTRAPYYWEEDYRLLKSSGINFLYIPCIDYQLISEVFSPELKKPLRMYVFLRVFSLQKFSWKRNIFQIFYGTHRFMLWELKLLI